MNYFSYIKTCFDSSAIPFLLLHGFRCLEPKVQNLMEITKAELNFEFILKAKDLGNDFLRPLSVVFIFFYEISQIKLSYIYTMNRNTNEDKSSVYIF